MRKNRQRCRLADLCPDRSGLVIEALIGLALSKVQTHLFVIYPHALVRSMSLHRSQVLAMLLDMGELYEPNNSGPTVIALVHI